MKESYIRGERHFTIYGTVDDASRACRKAARDMGLGSLKRESGVLSFRDRLHFWGWPVELRVLIAEGSEGIEVRLAVLSFGAQNAGQKEYVSALLDVFAKHTNQAAVSVPSVQDGWAERKRSLWLGCLTALGWLPWLLLIVALFVDRAYSWSTSFFPSWTVFVLALGISQGALVLRRQFVGTSLRRDPVVIGVCAVLVLGGVVLGATIG